MTNGLEQWLSAHPDYFSTLSNGFSLPSRFSLPLSSKQNLEKSRHSLFPSSIPLRTVASGSNDAAGRVLLWAHGQGVWVVTLFNPLVKHMAKQLLPIHVLQQLPSALLSAAPAAGEAREERGVSCSVHQTLITACLRNVCLRNPEAFL